MSSSLICRSGFIENAWRKDLCSNCFRTRDEHLIKQETNQITSGNTYQNGTTTEIPITSTSAYQYPAHPSQPLYNSWRGSGLNLNNSSMNQDYGLPVIALNTGQLSRYNSPSICSGINNSFIPIRQQHGSQQEQQQEQQAQQSQQQQEQQQSQQQQQQRPRSASNTLYNKFNTEISGGLLTTGKIISSSNRSSNNNSTIDSNSSSGVVVGVIVNGTKTSTSGPIPAIRSTLISKPNASVSVLVGRSSSYSNCINTIGIAASSANSRQMQAQQQHNRNQYQYHGNPEYHQNTITRNQLEYQQQKQRQSETPAVGQQQYQFQYQNSTQNQLEYQQHHQNLSPNQQQFQYQTQQQFQQHQPEAHQLNYESTNANYEYQKQATSSNPMTHQQQQRHQQRQPQQQTPYKYNHGHSSSSGQQQQHSLNQHQQQYNHNYQQQSRIGSGSFAIVSASANNATPTNFTTPAPAAIQQSPPNNSISTILTQAQAQQPQPQPPYRNPTSHQNLVVIQEDQQKKNIGKLGQNPTAAAVPPTVYNSTLLNTTHSHSHKSNTGEKNEVIIIKKNKKKPVINSSSSLLTGGGANSNINTKMDKTIIQDTLKVDNENSKIIMKIQPPVASVRISNTVSNTTGTTGNKSENCHSNKKGILKMLKNNSNKEKLNVNFQNEVIEITSHSLDNSDSDDSDDIPSTPPPDPLDKCSIPELINKTSNTKSEKDLNLLTLKNTNWNSIKNNLLGFKPIDIGIGITGKVTGNKPIINISTFESRKEPLRIVKKINGDSNDDGPFIRTLPSTTTASKLKSQSSSSKAIASSSSSLSKSESLTASSSSSSSKTFQSTLSQSVNHQQSQSQSQSSAQQSSTASKNLKMPIKTQQVTNNNLNNTQKKSNNGISSVIKNQEKSVESEIKKSSNSKTQLTNLIILTEDNKITSRTSFLREIIHEPIENLSSNKYTDTPIQDIITDDSLDLTTISPRVIKTELKLDLDTIPVVQSTYEDDSLEPSQDSGLDLNENDLNCIDKLKSELLELNNGFNSDSGNDENDYINNEPNTRPSISESNNNNLFISTTTATENEFPSSKLSPDSVISESESSESNTEESTSSTRGSNESIHETLNETVPISGPIIPPLLKRNAPLPPALEISNHSEIQASPKNQMPYTIDDLYDDVSSNSTSQIQNQPDLIQQQITSELDADSDLQLEESLYDDCITANSNNNTGSYDFTITDTNEPAPKTEGIEFLGIRKIDSESFLKQSSTEIDSSKASPRSSSPKVTKRRVVNQFFSTIGKRAGAAFSRSNSNTPSTNNIEKFIDSSNSNEKLFLNIKQRSLSQDQVNITRTQELYATLTPTSLKARGFSPVLNKLNKMDNTTTEDSRNSNKKSFSNSIKKFLRFGGSRDDNNLSENKYDFNLAKNEFQKKTSITSSSSSSASSSKLLCTTTTPRNSIDKSGEDTATASGFPPAVPQTRLLPPPPPPRLHSLDLLNTIGHSGMSSNKKPARPPPPNLRNISYNKVAPSFTSVFDGANNANTGQQLGQHPSNTDRYDDDYMSDSQQQQQSPYPYSNPPNKPRRKASMRNCQNNENSNGQSNSITNDGGAYSANYLETTYNHITSLNFETLKLIASQMPAKIRQQHQQSNQTSHNLLKQKLQNNQLKWSDFYLTDVEPILSGKGYSFYNVFYENENFILLLQENLSYGLLPLEFDSIIENYGNFEDYISIEFIKWMDEQVSNNEKYHKKTADNGSICKASCTIQKLPEYLNNINISPSRKYYALLQALDYWGKESLHDLLVFHQIPPSQDPSTEQFPNQIIQSKSKSSPSPNFGLVYVVSGRIKNNLLTQTSRSSFEVSIKHLLFNNNSSNGKSLLNENDYEILIKRITNTNNNLEIEATLKLYLQLKLFGPQAGDLDKILRYRSSKQVTQWMDKERAFCMKDAIERTLQRNSEPISPLRKSFIEFLMISDNCSKIILDLIVDLYPDL